MEVLNMRANLFEAEPGTFVKMKSTKFGNYQGFYLVSEDGPRNDVWSSVTWNPISMHINNLPPDEFVLSETFFRLQNRKLIRECLSYLSMDKKVQGYINGCPIFKLRKELCGDSMAEPDILPKGRMSA